LDKDPSFDLMITSAVPGDCGKGYRGRVQSSPTQLNILSLKKQFSSSTDSSVHYRMRTGSEETEEELGRQITPLVMLSGQGMNLFD